MSLFNHPYTCVLSGISATGEELEDADGGLPDEWINVSVTTRYINPKWEAIQAVKQGLLEQTLSQIPEGDRESQLVNVAIQVEAQYAQLEASTPKFSIEKEEIYISPPERDPLILAEVNKMRKLLGLKDIEIEEEATPSEPTQQVPPQGPQSQSASTAPSAK